MTGYIRKALLSSSALTLAAVLAAILALASCGGATGRGGPWATRPDGGKLPPPQADAMGDGSPLSLGDGSSPLPTAPLPARHGSGLGAPWSMFGKNEFGQRRSNHVGPATSAILWSYAVAGDLNRSPVIGADGTVYFSAGLEVVALNPDGSLKWSYTLPKTNGIGYYPNTPAIADDGTLYISQQFRNPDGAIENGYLFAFDSGGGLKWRTTLGGSTGATVPDGAGSPLLSPDDSRIHVAIKIFQGTSSIGGVVALNPDGTIAWSFQGNNWVYANTLVMGSDGKLVFGTKRTEYTRTKQVVPARLYKLNPDGSKDWEFQDLGNVFWDSIAIGDDGNIYTSAGGKLYSIASDGSAVNWSLTWPGGGGGGAAGMAIAGNGTLYIAHADTLFSCSPAGTIYWQFKTPTFKTHTSSPAVGGDGTIYIGSSSGYLFAVNPSGTQKWRQTVGAGGNGKALLFSSPAIGGDGTIYIGGNDHKFYAVGPGQG